MARCMKFPPTGYVWNGVSGDAVLQLIKVKKEERAAAEKRMKKEKRRRKKEEEEEEEEELEEGEIRESKCSDDHHKHKKMMKKLEFDQQMFNEDCENKSLERSSLTEELEQPVFDSLYDSSGSTKNVKKKKEQSCCFITGTDHSDHELQEKSDYLHCSLLRTNKAIANWKDETASRLISSETCCLHHFESHYRELIVSFVPPPIQIENPEFDHQEWLFERNLSRSNVNDRNTISNACIDDDWPHGRSSLYPYAQYLTQPDIPALPYTTLL